MHVFATAFAFLVLMAGVVYVRVSSSVDNSKLQENNTKVLSEETEEEYKKVDESFGDVGIEINSNTTETTDKTTPTNSPQNKNLDKYIYPNATVINQTDSEVSLTSTDNEEAITDWYKDLIRNSGMNVKSFVSTSTNGNVLNKLVGANSQVEINVEIKKDSNQVIVNVIIEIN